jgi:ppGpp synthetase/RelA/SpoT-type nucleotidyltranferase
VSKTKIDKLGDRLRKGDDTEEDLKFLDVYRRSFGNAYEIVVGMIRQKLALEPTGRPAKSTTALVEKLRRESIRLTQVQDIAGCRVIVADITEQERVVVSLKNLFIGSTVVDRRENPSYGYRAVHIIVSCEGKLIEIQVRTVLQHTWAELSEKVSDLVDPAIKYGGGKESIQSLLSKISQRIAETEIYEARLAEILGRSTFQDDVNKKQLADLRTDLDSAKQRITDALQNAIKQLEAGVIK